MHKIIIAIFSIFTLFSSCRPSVPVQKPKGYFRIELPEKKYKTFDSTGFPYTFKYPEYAIITRDTQMYKLGENPYWINVFVPQFDATIYLSYKTINEQTPIAQLVNESFMLSFAHDKKADFIESPEIKTSKGYKGILYKVGGNAASAYQFFVTDESKHFLRGSLYFNVAPNADSLEPLYQFLKEDIDTMIETLEFR